MNDELFTSLDEDGIFLSFEEILIRDLRTQITNTYSEFTGDISVEDNCFKSYITKIASGADPVEVIDQFEVFCSDNNREIEFDGLVSEILKLYTELLGINLDIDRENVSFDQLYDIYLVFVLNIKDTILLSTSGKLMLYEGIDVSTDKITQEMINNYILSDEFSPNDDFIKNAKFKSQMTNIYKINDLINDNVINIDHITFMKYINDFIFKNPIE